MNGNVESVLQTLKTASSFLDVFGPIPSSTKIDNQRRVLREQYAYLARMVHPDRVDEGDKRVAEEAFHLLTSMRKSAEEALAGGEYDRPFPKGAPPETETHETIIQSSKAVYRVKGSPCGSSDFSRIFPATMVGAAPQEVLLKIAAKPMMNPLLESEAKILRRCQDTSVPRSVIALRNVVPQLLDTFVVSGGTGTQYRVNVFARSPGYISLTEVLKAFPGGLDHRDAAWIIRRIVAQACAANMLGVVHGAIVPDHVLVHPITHNPLHIGWAHAVYPDQGERITLIIDRWKAWYPPEVFNKQAPTQQTDLYMVGKTIVWLLAGSVANNTLPKSVPAQLARVVLSCVDPSPARRPKSGRILLDDFTRVIRQLWGKEYRPLNIPVRS